jgi:hypothetical protein
VLLSSEERAAGAGGPGEMAFLFPFEERQDIRVAGGGWRKLFVIKECKGREELIPILNASTEFIYQKPDSKNINLE